MQKISQVQFIKHRLQKAVNNKLASSTEAVLVSIAWRSDQQIAPAQIVCSNIATALTTPLQNATSFLNNSSRNKRETITILMKFSVITRAQ